MARGSKVRINRSVVDGIVLAAADGMFAFAVKVVTTANVPDDPPLGQGLVEGGGALAWVDGKKIAGTTISGRAISKPRSVRTPKGQIVVIGGFGFPGHLVHNGSIHNHPRPFLAANLNALLPGASDDIAAVASPIVRGLK